MSKKTPNIGLAISEYGDDRIDENFKIIDRKIASKKNKPFVISPFSDFAKWAKWYGLSISQDTENTLTGQSSLKITSTDNTAARNTSISLNLSKATHIKFRFFAHAPSDIVDIQLYLASASSFADFAYFTITSEKIAKGWNEFVFKLTDANIQGTFAFTSLIKGIQIRLGASLETSISVDCLTAESINGKGSIIFTFDDGWNDVYTTVFPILYEKGFAGNVGVIVNRVGQTNYMTLSQLKDIHDHGWELFNHTETHPALSTFDYRIQEQELIACREYLNKNGFTEASDFVAYPYGGHNEETLKVLKNNGFKNARALYEGVEFQPSLNPYRLKTVNMVGGRPVAEITQQIDWAKKTGGTVILLGHKVATTSTESLTYTTADFKTVVDHVFNNLDSLEVLSLSQWIVRNN